MKTIEALRQLQQLIEQWKREQYSLWNEETTIIEDDYRPRLEITMYIIRKLQLRKIFAFCEAYGLYIQIKVNPKDNNQVLIIISSI